MPKVVSIAAGARHSLALLDDGTVRAWGFNLQGQLGDGTTTEQAQPITVVGLTDVIAIDAGLTSSYALRSDGTVWAWGNFEGDNPDARKPAPLPGLVEVIAISAGDKHALALQSDGSVWSWGEWHSEELGRDTGLKPSLPAPVGGLVGITAVAAGSEHSLALTSAGEVWAWGSNYFGQLGNGSSTEEAISEWEQGLVETKLGYEMGDGQPPMPPIGRSTPTLVVNWWPSGQFKQIFPQLSKKILDASSPNGLGLPPNVIAIAAGDSSSLAITSDGYVWGWGANEDGQLGDRSTTDHHQAIRVQCPGNVTQVDTTSHALALTSGGHVWAWGRNEYGQVGDGTHDIRTGPIKLRGLADISRVRCGDNHSLVLDADGRIWSWGRNDHGQLGDGTTSDRDNPQRLSLTD